MVCVLHLQSLTDHQGKKEVPKEEDTLLTKFLITDYGFSEELVNEVFEPLAKSLLEEPQEAHGKAPQSQESHGQAKKH